MKNIFRKDGTLGNKFHRENEINRFEETLYESRVDCRSKNDWTTIRGHAYRTVKMLGLLSAWTQARKVTNTVYFHPLLTHRKYRTLGYANCQTSVWPRGDLKVAGMRLRGKLQKIEGREQAGQHKLVTHRTAPEGRQGRWWASWPVFPGRPCCAGSSRTTFLVPTTPVSSCSTLFRARPLLLLRVNTSN